MSITARRTVTLVLAVLALAAGVALMATKADAASGPRGCVSQREWSRIHDNMSRGQVQSLIGDATYNTYRTLNGDWSGEEMWSWYKPCKAFGNNHSLVVWFDNYSQNGPGFRVYDYYRSATV